jgi:16S rRNA (cytidine1402-2'-O)-methyltransferase
LDSHLTATIRQWYNKRPGFMPGTLFVVATPIGNLEDVSARALRILREATLIAAEDTRRAAQLLSRFSITTPTTSLHEHNEGRKTAALVDRLKGGDSIALVSDAGTPTISDPGQQLIRSAIDAGIRIESIPGPSAALAALAASGLPSDTFTFLGFPPTRAADRARWFSDVRSAGRTVVFFEAPHRIRQTIQDLRDALGDAYVVVARELTKIHEELVRGPISDVLSGLRQPRGEYTVVVDVGHLTELGHEAAPGDPEIRAKFYEMTESLGLTRRAAISALAKRYRLPARDVYAAIERARDSVK